jgi:hypothetical protein
VFDITGREVATLQNGYMNAGSHRMTFDARGMASGVYFVRAMTSQGTIQTQRVVLVR